MVNQKVINYLKEGKRRGIGINLLKQKLLDAGWEEKDVDDAVLSIGDLTNKQISGEMQRPVRMQPYADKGPKDVFNEKIGLFSKIGKAIAHPTELFERTRSEGIWPALAYLLVLSVIPFVISSLIFILFSSFVAAFLGSLISSLSQSFLYIVLLLFILYFIISPITSFVWAGILHLFIKMYGGKGSYSDTFRAQIYSATPVLLFGLIPFVNFAVGIWTFVLALFGLSINHEISKLRAFLALLTLAIFVIILVVLVWIFIGPSLVVPATSFILLKNLL